MFWCGETIKVWGPKFKLVTPFDDGQIDCAAYTLRVGPECYVTPDHYNKRDAGKKIYLKYNDDEDRAESVTIPSNQFAWIMTEECINIPKHLIGFISLKAGKNLKV
ncbi:dCTP deaminase domain-containing protein [Euryhalocaulis caribicus]|uniref:dCTP deaminase domain-containing protein n=1 Tax=Euryhalocaulis caribicus TaxID=1161401 RepID=UPI003BAD5ABD